MKNGLIKGVDDINEVIPMLNKAFKKNFKTLLPKLYTSNLYAKNHFTFYENNKLEGVIASIPSTLVVGENKLQAYGIGMVGVKKSARGKGIMSKMLVYAIDDAQLNHADFMFLSGLRERYEHYGFVPCGAELEYTLVKSNLKHKKAKVDYSFIPLSTNLIETIANLYNQQSMHYIRENFMQTIKSWNTSKHFAIMLNGEVKGHLSFKWRIVDINIIDGDVSDVVLSYFQQMVKLPFLKVVIYPNRPDFMLSLSSIAESCSLLNSGHFKILNYKNILSVLLNYSAGLRPEIDYKLTLNIEDTCNLSIAKSGNVVTVLDTSEKPDLILKKNEATNILFSPHLSLINGLPFTLSLFINHLDNV